MINWSLLASFNAFAVLQLLVFLQRRVIAHLEAPRACRDIRSMARGAATLVIGDLLRELRDSDPTTPTIFLMGEGVEIVEKRLRLFFTESD